MLMGKPRTALGRLAERVDPFATQRRLIWRAYPDPLWHLRPLLGDGYADRLAVPRNAALARLPLPSPIRTQVDGLWEREHQVLAQLAGARRGAHAVRATRAVTPTSATAERLRSREMYILSYVGFGTSVGQAIDGGRGALVGGTAAGAVAYYRSREAA
jgi:hypothetical protein